MVGSLASDIALTGRHTAANRGAERRSCSRNCPMLITAESTVADIATHAPATIPVFQRHQIDFCCGGRLPLANVCADRHIDAAALVAELEAAAAPDGDVPSWADATLTALVAHIQ